MPSNDYHFVTRWFIEATPDEITEVLADAPALPRWWPAVYLAVEELSPGHPKTHVGREIALYTKGWLPYTLRWQFRVTENRLPEGFAIEAWGDFEGRGVWTFRPRGPVTEVEYDWRIRAHKPLLKHFSFAMKPLFAANHQWAMRMGEQSLQLEIARRRAARDGTRASVPPPPPPTFPWAIGRRDARV